MEKFQNKYRIPSARLKGYDYGANGAYFVTINTKHRLHYFGKIVRDDAYSPAYLQSTPIGKIAHEYWTEIPKHYPFVELDEFTVMPNHIHGILFFNKPDKTDWTPNKFGVQSQNLGSVMRAFKSSVKRYANDNHIEFIWQSRFHDNIIKDEEALNNIRRYIANNPDNWANDEMNKPEQ